LAARVDLAAETCAVAGAVGGQALLQAVFPGIASGMGQLLGEPLLAPFIGARGMRQAQLPRRRWRTHALVATGLRGARLRLGRQFGGGGKRGGSEAQGARRQGYGIAVAGADR